MEFSLFATHLPPLFENSPLNSRKRAEPIEQYLSVQPFSLYYDILDWCACLNKHCSMGMTQRMIVELNLQIVPDYGQLQLSVFFIFPSVNCRFIVETTML